MNNGEVRPELLVERCLSPGRSLWPLAGSSERLMQRQAEARIGARHCGHNGWPLPFRQAIQHAHEFDERTDDMSPHSWRHRARRRTHAALLSSSGERR